MSENKKRKGHRPRKWVYVGDPIPRIDENEHASFILHYQKSLLLSLVKRELLTTSQMERVIDELERQHLDKMKQKHR